MLTGGAKDLPARQQTLRSAIEWSYDLLSEGEKRLFRRLAVFVGGRTIESADDVCNGEGDLGIDVLEGMLSLVDKSLLKQEEGDDGESRFVMLETIHEYAREKLWQRGEAEELRRRHRDYFLAMAEESKLALNDARRPTWVAKLEQEHDNLRAAYEWSVHTDGPDDDYALQITSALCEFWMTRFHRQEWKQRLEFSLSSSEARTTARADALLALAIVTWHLSDPREGYRLAEESLALSRELDYKAGIASSLKWISEWIVLADQTQDRFNRSAVLLEKALSINRELGQKYLIAQNTNGLAWAVACMGDYARARLLAEEGLNMSRPIGYQRGIGDALELLGELARAMGEYAQASSWYTQSLATYREAGIRGRVVILLQDLSYALLRQGEVRRAAELIREALALNKEADMQFHYQAFALSAAVAIASGDVVKGVHLLSFSQQLMEARGEMRDPVADQAEYELDVATSKAMLSEEEWQKAWEEGQVMSKEDALAYALEES